MQNTQAITAYIDMAFAVHKDSKSHSSAVLMSKSPTEAELTALTENLGLVEFFHEFMEFIMKEKFEIPVVYQDCNVIVLLVMKGGGVTKSKYRKEQTNLGKEMVDEKRIIYQDSNQMVCQCLVILLSTRDLQC